MSNGRFDSDADVKRDRAVLGRPTLKPGNYLLSGFLNSRPNRFPLWERTLNILVSLFLLGYGSYGLIINDLHIPGRRSEGVHLHGIAALSMSIAMCFAAAMLLSVVIDHYDTRDNEAWYRKFALCMKYSAIVFFALSFVLHILWQPS